MMARRSTSTQPEETTADNTSRLLDDMVRRMEIIEEEFLRRDVERESAMRLEHPERWRALENARRARNRDKAGLNRRLRAEGLAPVSLELSLAQRVKKLQQLERSDRARSAKATRRS
jgi:hypothetical protein